MKGHALPRELVRASAGTGKTFWITNRLLGLLAAVAEPDEVLASTFTRKAAGEILDRVLERLAGAALSRGRARELAGHASLAEGGGAAEGLADREDAARLLERLVRKLHRIDVSTLDAYFIRAARSFSLELGMPPGWTVADPTAERRLRAEAVQTVLREGDVGATVELIRLLSRGEATRRVHDRLLDQADVLLRLHRERAPDAEDPWSPFEGVEAPDDPEAARRRLAARLRAVEPPLTGSGSPHSGWVKGLEDAAAALGEGDWGHLFSGGLGGKVIGGETEYYGKSIPEIVRSSLEGAVRLARADLAPTYDAQARAMGRFAERYGQRFVRRQREAGTYRFEDVTDRLWSGDPITARPDLAYRLDRRSEHVLLDEFQDTSVAQWEVLRPLVDGLVAEPARERALVVVADTKQSIYGWRGADPEIVERLGERYGLARRRLEESWRSSPAVLDFVNRIFGGIAENDVLGEMDGGPSVAAGWAEAFDEHRPAPDRRGEPGHVTVRVGPNTGEAAMAAVAARCAAELHEAAPRAHVALLTRTNDMVARLIHELRLLGIEASEEGGTSVDDAAPVAAVLALLRMADHPGDTIARYHVASTPLGRAVGYTDHEDGIAARRRAREIRRRLARDGYGAVVSGWARALAADVDPTELRRLEQLAELGFRWEERSTLRPGDFVRFVERERVEDPLAARVRVMTVHQAKGLEFDAVILPELDRSMASRGRAPALPERDPATGRVRRVFPRVSKSLRPLFPEIGAAHRQARASRLRDELSQMYVGITRAARSLHLLLAADPDSGNVSRTKSPARIVRAALGEHERVIEEGELLLELGTAGWHRELGLDREAREPGPREPEGAPQLRVDRSAARKRILTRTSPSEMEGGGRVDLAEMLRPDAGRRYRRGTVVHAWCAELRWIEEGLPDRTRLTHLARDSEPHITDEDIKVYLEWFRDAIQAPEVQEALSQQAAAARLGGRPEVRTERAFTYRRGEEIVTGAIDRLVLHRSDGEHSPVVSAEVLDFKTDEVDGEAGLREKLEFYRPQIRAYREAVASMYGLDPEVVTARLVFLAPGVVREV